MTEQKVIIDTNHAFIERVNNLLAAGWRVVPGTATMTPIPAERQTLVMAMIVLERERHETEEQR